MLSGVLSSSSKRVLGIYVRRGGEITRRTRPRWRNNLMTNAAASQWIHTQPEEVSKASTTPSQLSTTSNEAATEPPSPGTDTPHLEEEAWEFGEQHPNYELRRYYEFKYPDHVFDNDVCYKKEFRWDKAEKHWWTATFICPVSDDTYPSGTLQDVEPRMHVGGQVYYKKGKYAIAAASARAIDAIRFQEAGVSFPRLCLENPAETDGVPSATNGPVLENNHVESSAEETRTTSPHGPHDVEVFPQMEPNVPVAPIQKRLGITDYSESNVAEDDYTIHHVSGSGASSSPGNKTTLERVMNVWAQALTDPIQQQQQQQNTIQPQNTALPLPPSWDPSAHHKAAIDDAMSWYKSIQSKSKKSSGRRQQPIFKTTSTPMTLVAGNAILTALAQANQQSHGSLNTANVEPMATEIVNQLLKRSEPLNADTYNTYMQCLSGTAEEVARRAEDLLKHMIKGQADGGEHVLPKPNIDTFNTVLQLWARVDGKLGSDRINRTYNTLVSEENDEITVTPNRETFLSILSAMANGSNRHHGYPTRFNQTRAQLWISRAQQCCFSQLDETLRPDTQFYNAPLRLSGGGHPWDRHDVIFSKGFVDERDDDELVMEAHRMQDWHDEMEHLDGIAPNIETYESVIQAWVRTGTLNGVLKAESLALRLIEDSDASLRLQTFHPILAAWAYSGDERGPAKVQEWVNRLYFVSKTTPKVKPDGRVRVLVIKAWRMKQQRFMEKVKSESIRAKDAVSEGEISENNEANDMTKILLQSAQACESGLERLCDDLFQGRMNLAEPAFFLEAASFNDVVRAWGNVAIGSMPASYQTEGQQDDFTHHDAITKVLQTVKRFDDMIQFYRSMEGKQDGEGSDGEVFHVNGDNGGTGGWHARQLQHLMSSAPSVYASAIAVLNELDEIIPEQHHRGIVQVADYGEGLFARYLPRAEMMLRRSEEYRAILDATVRTAVPSASEINIDKSNLSPAKKEVPLHHHYDDNLVAYEDMYVYQTGEEKDLPEPLTLYTQIVEGCEKLTSRHDVGDAVRLCILILDLVTRYSTSESTPNKIDITNLCSRIVSVLGSKVSSPMERGTIMTHIGNIVHSVADATGPSPSAPRNDKDATDSEAEGMTVEDNPIHNTDATENLSRKIVLDRVAVLAEIEGFLCDGAEKELLDHLRHRDASNRMIALAGGKRRRPRRKKKNRRNPK